MPETVPDPDAVEEATVLVVDDEKEVADAYALRLRGAFEVATAYGGAEALRLLDEREIDVVLLDRRMPEVSGDDVLREINDSGMPCRVIMLTAIDPDFDIIDMPFDDYLCKPIAKEDLFAAVTQQLRAAAYERLSEYFAAAAKTTVLGANRSTETLLDSPEYADVAARATALRDELEAELDDFEEVAAAFEQIDRAS